MFIEVNFHHSLENSFRLIYRRRHCEFINDSQNVKRIEWYLVMKIILNCAGKFLSILFTRTWRFITSFEKISIRDIRYRSVSLSSRMDRSQQISSIFAFHLSSRGVHRDTDIIVVNFVIYSRICYLPLIYIDILVIQ